MAWTSDEICISRATTPITRRRIPSFSTYIARIAPKPIHDSEGSERGSERGSGRGSAPHDRTLKLQSILMPHASYEGKQSDGTISFRLN